MTRLVDRVRTFPKARGSSRVGSIPIGSGRVGSGHPDPIRRVKSPGIYTKGPAIGIGCKKRRILEVSAQFLIVSPHLSTGG